MLAGASVLALVLAGTNAFAAQLNGSWMSAPSPANYAAQAAASATKAQAEAAARSQASMLRAMAAIKSLTQLQQAARNVAVGIPSTVPNGLIAGGLVPAVNSIIKYTDDPTGLATWDGAELPTEKKTNGITEVTIKQFDPQAILSWSSFNIGSRTQLIFDQQGNSSWTVLNRVTADTAPSRILGSIRADGTVLVINRNGVIFGGTAQINVGSLTASALDFGTPGSTLSTYNSNRIFKQPLNAQEALSFVGPDVNGAGIGDIVTEAGAKIETTSTGRIILMGHHVTNAGTLSAPDGQVILAAGESIQFVKNTGDADSADPNVRGLLVDVRPLSGLSDLDANTYYVHNAEGGIIQAERGNITLSTVSNQLDANLRPQEGGAIRNEGLLWSTTSVSRNGSIIISGGDISLAGTGVLAITPDTNAETIPQDPTSLGAFKPSEILIGSANARPNGSGTDNVALETGAFVYAPSANVEIGAGGVGTDTDGVNGGEGTPSAGTNPKSDVYVSSTFIDKGVLIDVGGLKGVEIPADRNEVTIGPVKGNETRDTPLIRAIFDGVTLYLDPRKSGVRADGVAWIGSPLIDAASYYQLVGVGVSELMTKGGNVSIAGGAANVAKNAPLGGVVINKGATIDISGGWVTYAGGMIRESRVIDGYGRIVPISQADPTVPILGVYGGFTVVQPRWGIVNTYNYGLKSDTHYEPGYIEGRDAGSLSINASTAALNQTLYAQAYAGTRQLLDSQAGNGTSGLANDRRAVQGAASQLPVGGLLRITAGVDITVKSDPREAPDVAYGAPVTIGEDGSYTAPPAQEAARSTTVNTPIEISDKLAAQSGLSQLSLGSSGNITVAADAKIEMQPGAVFTASSGRQINIDGSITTPGGIISLKTGFGGIGSMLDPSDVAVGSFDIKVTGNLSVAGQWVNEYQSNQNAPFIPQNHAWLNGGSIEMYAASNLLLLGKEVTDRGGTQELPQRTVTDVSGSIIIDPSARLRLTSGGHVDRVGNVDLATYGGNLKLISDTAYYGDYLPNGDRASGFRVVNIVDVGGTTDTRAPINNPSQINARITFDPSSIEAHGFAGGGTFTLGTPEIALGDGKATVGTVLPLDFFSESGFGRFNITSAKTAFLKSTFNNGLGGYNALLQTQTLTIEAGQTLSLSQSLLPSLLSSDQTAALRDLKTGGDVTTLLSASVPTDAFDQRAVSLNLGGLIELHVADGGKITGAAGSSISASKIFNEGTIRIAGGTIVQREVLPLFYGSGNGGEALPGVTAYNVPAIGLRNLGDAFTVNADGTIDVNANSKVRFFDQTTGTYTDRFLTNGELAGNFANGSATPMYLLGGLDADQGIVLGAGSVTDLSGTVLRDPRAMFGALPLNVGRTIGGGTIATAATTADIGTSYLGVNRPTRGWITPAKFTAQPGARIDLSGVSAQFDLVGYSGGTQLGWGAALSPEIGKLPSWSDGGNLIASNGATLTGAIIDAHGGAPEANGGLLAVYTPTLVARDPATPTEGMISAEMITQAGFDSLVAIGSVSSSGDVTVNLRNQFILQGVTYDTADNRTFVYGSGGNNATAALVVPQIRSGGGRLEINAGYIGLRSTIDRLDSLSEVAIGEPGKGSIVFNAGAIDIVGSVIMDRSVADATLATSGDLRLIGIQPWQLTYDVFTTGVTPALNGSLAVNGNLNLYANRIYPTTGSTFNVTSNAADGIITVGRVGPATSSVPYSAGGNLTIAAANIVHGGNIQVPFGSLTLGTSTAISGATSGLLAPVTQNVTILADSVTSVSAKGLNIPYGTTTDLKEWYFSPTGDSPLTGPPQKVLRINGGKIAINDGATVDISGGGDVYTYEFVAGTGGSRDVLSRFNSDPYSGNNGYQYADQRQVYAIVPGLSDAPVAAYDPIYSADYSSISTGSQVGTRVYLNAAPGLKAGWYTLLPAQYAMLPGGMRVVEQTGATNVLPGTSQQLGDGSLIVAGRYGNAIAGTSQSDQRLFSVQGQATFLQYSNIVTTSGNANAVAAAIKSGSVLAPIGLDAGRLILNPGTKLIIDAAIKTAAAPGGRGALVDIAGQAFEIVSDLSQAQDPGAIQLTAGSLQNLNASSLLIGGIRTDNADGTTSLAVTAQSIVVANDADHPITAAEIILAVDDTTTNPVGASLTLKDGATLIAQGNLGDNRAGAYIIDGTTGGTTSGRGALVRVANGPQRLVVRKTDPTKTLPEAVLDIGAARLSGRDIMLDSSDQNHISSGLRIQNAERVALGSDRIGFGAEPAHYDGLVITDALRATLTANGADLTLRSQTSIDFAGGTYDLGDITFNAGSISSLDGGDVTINGGQIGLGNAGSTQGCAGCLASGANLTINADQVSFTGGTVSLIDASAGKGNLFGGGVQLTGREGIFAAGQKGGLDAGGARLSLITPFIDERTVTGVSNEPSYDVTFRTTGDLAVSRGGLPSIDVSKIAGVPGSSISFVGRDISVEGTYVRATAGAVSLQASAGISVGGGATLAAPGYTKTFGDSADPQVRASAGGSVTLAAADGDIALGDALLSVAGGAGGNAGKLTLSSPNGTIDLSQVRLDGRGTNGGGTFVYSSEGNVGATALNKVAADSGFTGGFDMTVAHGDLILGAGETLRSGHVSLTTNDGTVAIAGTIDTSGVNGGDISLFGRAGVTLEDTAVLRTTAKGYGTFDTRRASSGNVILGTDFTSSTTNPDGSISGTSGNIVIKAGARIDLAAAKPDDRLVPFQTNGLTYYQVVQGDAGGKLTLRAPVVLDARGQQTVNIDVATSDSVVGASSVIVEGFQRWDLQAVAASGKYVGVTCSSAPCTGADATVTLDLRTDLDTANADGTRSTVGGINFLGDNGSAGAATIVDFVQNFDLSKGSAYGRLGGLAGKANFHAQAGLDLFAPGHVVLASNWNLGAGTVDLVAARNAGDVAINTRLQDPTNPTTGYVVVPGREAHIFQNYTSLIYRTGGRVAGEAPIVSLRSGGNLDLKGSISDGTFLFRDQTDPRYLQNVYLGGSNQAPYSVLGNSAAALSTPNGDKTTGDPLGNAIVFPLLADYQAAGSSSYRLVAGASAARASTLGVNPYAVDLASAANLTISGLQTYSYFSFAGTRYVPVQSLVRTGTGEIALAAASDVDLRGSVDPLFFDVSSGLVASPTRLSTAQLGGSPVYTVGRRADPSRGTETLIDPLTNREVAVDLSGGFAALASTTFALSSNGGPKLVSAVGELQVDPLALTDGGDITISAGRDVLGRFSAYFNNNAVDINTHPWDVVADNISIFQPDFTFLNFTRSGINTQLFREGVGALGGGDILIEAGRDVSDLTVAVDGTAVYGTASTAGGGATGAASRFGGGTATITAGRDIIGGRLVVASGQVTLDAGGDVRAASYQRSSANGPVSVPIGLNIEGNDASVAISARGSVTMAAFNQLGGGGDNSQTAYKTQQPPALTFSINTYSAWSGLSIKSNGDVSITDTSFAEATSGGATPINFTPIYPASLVVDAINGSIDLPPLIMYASAVGQLGLYAGWDIGPTAIGMLDNPTRSSPIFGIGVTFPAVLPDATSTYLANLHNQDLTHRDDPFPAYIYAAHDLDQVTLSLPKQGRVWAGRDITDMVFFGQNLATTDVTRIVAGRDITATTRVISPESSSGNPLPNARPLPAFQGNTFVIGGPGTFMLEAGRDIGPFLNSAVARQPVGSTFTTQTFTGGVVAIGNFWNPYLPAESADIDVLFGVAKGADFKALRDAYVAPGTAANAVGGYSAKLIAWMQANQAQKLKDDFGTVDVTAEQAYAAFLELAQVQQRGFLIGDVYFNELRSTAGSAGNYQRGYQAINTLFPASLGYTANSLSGGSNGAAQLVSTGDLDLRLATIQTQFGGDVNILGPGGNIIAGSVVATSVQAARRSYQGYNLYGVRPLDYNSNYLPFYDRSTSVPVGNGSILAIPPGGEGILTLRGGDINTFSDQSLLLNQSRLFTEGGGNILLWSSNGDLNAGQGPKTSANFPPIVVRIDDRGYTTVDQSGSVSGAGIAALAAFPGAPPSNVDLLAPRGTIDAGAAGVRVSGNLTVAAVTVVNADNISVGGSSTGVPTVSVPSLALSNASNAAAAAAQSVESPTKGNSANGNSIIIVEVLGYGGGSDDGAAGTKTPADDTKKNGDCVKDGSDPARRCKAGGKGAGGAADNRPVTP